MIFHKPLPSALFMLIFMPLIWFGFIKLLLWHYPRFYFTKNRKSYRFIYHYCKAVDQCACAGSFDGNHDETISNRAGRMFKEHGWNSPWWVITTKKLTEPVEPDHIEKSIEPLRPDPEE